MGRERDAVKKGGEGTSHRSRTNDRPRFSRSQEAGNAASTAMSLISIYVQLRKPCDVLPHALLQSPPPRPPQRLKDLRPPTVINLAQIPPQLSKVHKLPPRRDLAEDFLHLRPVERLCDGPDARVRDGGEGESGKVEEAGVLGVNEPF